MLFIARFAVALKLPSKESPTSALRGGNPRFHTISKPINCQGILEHYFGQMRVSWCRNHYKFVLSAGAKVEERSDEIPPWRGKNRDDFPLHGTTCPVQREVVPRSGKQLTHIVRVTVSIF
jgi:hypothetical protein